MKTSIWLLALLVILGCSGSKNNVTAPSESNKATGMKLSLINESLPASLTRAEVVVEGPGMTRLQQDLSIEGNSIIGNLPEVEVGDARTFTINGYNAQGEVILQGSTTVDVRAGVTLELSVTLTEVGPTEVNEITLTLPSGLRMEFVLVPEGSFTMGSTDGEANERPIHQVYLDSYYIGKYEVSNLAMTSYLNAISDSLGRLSVCIRFRQ